MIMREYLRLIRTRWVFILCGVLLGLILAILTAVLVRPEYESTAKVFVSTSTATSVSDLSQGTNFTQQVVKSYASVAVTPWVLDSVADSLDSEATSASLAKRVTADAALDTSVIDISATSSSPAESAKIANAVASSLPQAIQKLGPNETNTSAVKLTVIQPAEPGALIAPRTSLYLILGLAVGLFVGLVGAVVAQRLDNKIRDVDSMMRESVRPLIGTIPWSARTVERPVALRDPANETMAESVRTARATLELLPKTDEGNVYVVTSAIPGEGKSTTAVNLAVAAADSGRRVLLIDADLRRPKVASFLGIDGGLGVTDILLQFSTETDAIQEWESAGLHVLPAGRPVANPNELVQSAAMQQLLNRAASKFDLVLVDAPPVLAVSDAGIIAHWASGVVMICAIGRVTHGQLAAAMQSLDQIGASVTGYIATFVRRTTAGNYGYGGYSYGGEAIADQ